MAATLAPIPTRQCRDCDFWVTAEAHSCPNCGIRKPYVDARRGKPVRHAPPESSPVGFSRSTGAVAGSLAGGFVGWLVGLLLIAQLGWEVAGGAVPLELLTAILFVPLGAFAGWHVDQRLHFPARVTVDRAPEYLALFEWKIRQRLQELAARERQLRAVEDRVGEEEPNPQWQRVNAPLEAARIALARQRGQYRAKLCEIGLVRLQNSIAGASANLEQLSDRQCARRVDVMMAALGQAQGLLREWEAEDEQAAGHPCARRLRDMLEVGDQLRQQLLAQQAVIAVREAAPVATAAPPVETPRLAPGAEHRFQARAELGEFSSAFRALEEEYARLQAQETGARELG